MNWLDFVILALMAWFTLSAYLSGLIRETLGLASVILGVILAGLFHDEFADNLDFFIESETASNVIAFITIFVIVAVGGWALSLFLRRTADLLLLGWADHAGGALFGFIKAVLIIQALTVIFVLQPALGMEAVIADSAIGSFFLDSTPVVRALLPAEFDRAISAFPA